MFIPEGDSVPKGSRRFAPDGATMGFTPFGGTSCPKGAKPEGVNYGATEGKSFPLCFAVALKGHSLSSLLYFAQRAKQRFALCCTPSVLPL